MSGNPFISLETLVQEQLTAAEAVRTSLETLKNEMAAIDKDAFALQSPQQKARQLTGFLSKIPVESDAEIREKKDKLASMQDAIRNIS